MKLTNSQAATMILHGTVRSFGFQEAKLKDIPDFQPMEYGWFDLTERDHNARIIGNELLLDLWFNDHGYKLPQKAIQDRRCGSEPEQRKQVKLTVAVDLTKIEYVRLGQNRVWTDELINDPAIEKNAQAIEAWENAWSTYIQKMNRLEELEAMGRYGYQLRQPSKAVQIAKDKLKQLDPDFCKQIGII